MERNKVMKPMDTKDMFWKKKQKIVLKQKRLKKTLKMSLYYVYDEIVITSQWRHIRLYSVLQF